MTQEIVGTRKGDYEILALLGMGGMGQVYKVRNVLSDRVEAMKVLLPNLVGQKMLADRFIREIRVLAGLHHPNIAELRTALTIENELVMIMDFVEGSPLSSLTQRGEIPYPLGLSYMNQVLAALNYAHSRKIIHRDIKPANMMLTPNGVVKLMDFGIARQEGDAALTTTHSTVGSIAYMSPEQIRGEPIDARSDLYSIGVSLYEMITGQRPFQGDTGFSIMRAHLETIPRPPIELRPGLPAAISDLILTCLAKEPQNRFQSAAALSREICRLLPELETAGLAIVPLQLGETMITGAEDVSFQATEIASAAPIPSQHYAARPHSFPIPSKPPAGFGTSQQQTKHGRAYAFMGASIALVGLVAAGFFMLHHKKTEPSQQNNVSSIAGSVSTPPVSNSRVQGSSEVPASDSQSPSQAPVALSEIHSANADTKPPTIAQPNPAAIQKVVPQEPEDAQWRRIATSLSVKDFDQFLSRYPNGAHHNEADGRREQLLWAQARDLDPADVRQYLNAYPNGPHASQLQEALDSKAIDSANDLPTLRALLDKYPTGDMHAKVVSRYDDFKWAQDQKDQRGLHDYLDEFPDGKHAAEAGSALAKLEIEPSAEKVSPQSRNAIAAPVTNSPAQALDDAAAITATLSAYAQAITATDTTSMRKIWPKIPGDVVRSWVDTFESAKDLRATIETSSKPVIQGSEATVRAVLATSFTANGQSNSNTQKISVKLKKVPGAQPEWQIESIK